MFDQRNLIKNFYIHQYKLLKCFALWDISDKIPLPIRIGYRTYFWIILTSWTLPFNCGMLIQLVLNIGDVFEVIKVSIFFATSTAALVKYISMKLHTKDFEDIFALLRSNDFLPQNQREWKEYRKAIDLSTYVWKIYAALSISSISSLFLIQYFNTEREFNVSLYNPFDMDSDIQYFMMAIYQLLSLTAVCFVNLCFDSLAASFFINIKGQLDVLGIRLENIGHGSLTQAKIMRELKNCIIYYQRLFDLSHTMEELLRMPMSIQIACSVMVLIANFYSMSLLSGIEDFAAFVKLILYQTCMLMQIFILCYFASEVSMKSSDISFDLYNAHWYNWNKTNRKLVLLTMIRFGEPIRIKSVNKCYSFNLMAFTSIVNSSYSYFALLKRINS